MALVLLYGGWLAIDGQVTVGDIVAFNAYVLHAAAAVPHARLHADAGPAGGGVGGAHLRDPRRASPTIVDRPGAVDLVDADGRGRASTTCTFGYGDGPPGARATSTCTSRPGETVALVGRTGTGKSTVARLLARFYDVADGAVRVDGHDVRDLTLAQPAPPVGMVLDEPFLFSCRSATTSPTAGPTRRSRRSWPRPARPAPTSSSTRCPRATTRVVGERGYTLSGGQRQRIAIARTLLVEPADPGARRRHSRHRRAGRAADPRRARAR